MGASTDPTALSVARILTAPDLAALRRALQAGLNAAYRGFMRELRTEREFDADRDRVIREGWEERRAGLHAAFRERLGQIEGRARG